MTMKYMMIALMILVIFTTACSTTQDPMTSESSAMIEESPDQVMESKETMEESWDEMVEEPSDGQMTGSTMEESSNDQMMESKESKRIYTGQRLAGSTTPYLIFNEEDYVQALKENKIVILNFYANWCPLCKAEEPEALAAFDTLEAKNVIGFRINYKDSETDDVEEGLAREFGVAYQHTKVIIKDGKRVLKAPDSWDTKRYLDEINKLV